MFKTTGSIKCVILKLIRQHHIFINFHTLFLILFLVVFLSAHFHFLIACSYVLKATLLNNKFGPIPIVLSIRVRSYISRLNFNSNSRGLLANK